MFIMSQLKKWKISGLFGWLIVTFAAAALGGGATINAKALYGQLVQPSWAPPAFLFGPVWTILYILMGISAWLIWRSGGFGPNRTALTLYLVQLVLNALWSWIFFAWQSGFWAFADILLLWVLIIVTLVSFWRVRPLAGGLLCPYLLWVTFASVLNYSVWQLNLQILG